MNNLRTGIFVCIVLLSIAARASAEAPRISLDLHHKDLTQAVTALQQSTDAVFIVEPRVTRAQGVDLQFSNVPFDRAVAIVAAAYDVCVLQVSARVIRLQGCEPEDVEESASPRIELEAI